MGIFKYKENPILTREQVPFPVNSIFNAGAVKFAGEYLLLCRTEMQTGRSSFVVARSSDGIHFEIDSKPCLIPDDHEEFFKYVEWGIEDPRITQIEDKFFIAYTGYSRYEPLVLLAQTSDFQDFKILGPISEPSNKDAVLFPEKISGFFWKLDRPSGEKRRDIWISRSPDLIHWGGYQIVMAPEKGTWEHNKIGASTPPVKSEQGWLLLYHGVRRFSGSVLYRQGVVLLDREKPWRVLGRSESPVLSPELSYERVGDVGNVVFSTGWIVEDNGNVKIYYSGADTNICLATTTVEELLKVCK